MKIPIAVKIMGRLWEKYLRTKWCCVTIPATLVKMFLVNESSSPKKYSIAGLKPSPYNGKNRNVPELNGYLTTFRVRMLEDKRVYYGIDEILYM